MVTTDNLKTEFGIESFLTTEKTKQWISTQVLVRSFTKVATEIRAK